MDRPRSDRCDVEALQRFFADDFIGINPMGAEITKADVIAQIGSSDYEPESIVNDVRQVRCFGDVAVVSARGTAKGKYKGGNWQAIAAHASPMPDAA
jgi:ketosteroid isomerase-like protein